MRILVTGASGFIGQALVPQLERDGHEVIPLARGRNGAPADLARIDTWASWPASIDAVIHLAALNPQRSDAASRDDAALMAANATGTQVLARRAGREGVKRFVYASTNLVHPLSDRPFDEDAPLVPQNAYAASKLVGEDAVRRELCGGATQWTILRLPPVYGPGAKGGVSSLLRMAGTGLPLPFAGPGARRSLLSRANAVSAISLAVSAQTASGETFLVADGPAWTLGEIVAFLRRETGRGPGLFRAPIAPLRSAARLLGRAASVERVFGSLVVDDRRFRDTTRWMPPQTTEDGLREAMRGEAS